MPKYRNVSLLARLENKSGIKWLDFYEDNSFKVPTYYYTCYNNGGKLGIDKKEAAKTILVLAKNIGGLKLSAVNQ